MTRGKYALLAGAMLAFAGLARFFDLDLGYFGLGLLVVAAVFGLMAVVTPSEKGSENG